MKIVISSATIDAELFKKFFNLSKPIKDGIASDTAIILSVEGRMYQVDEFFLENTCPDYVKETVNMILRIHNKEKDLRGDILAFLTGQEEVMDVVNLLREHIEAREKDDLHVLPMYGTLTNADQLKVFFSAPKGTRKAIIATNIAETSVTIPGIVYVIDCGFVKLKWFDAESNTDSLAVVPISKAAAEQRAGRAGRIRHGKVFRLYPEDEYEKFANQTVPEIQRSDLCSTILFLKALGIKNIIR